MEEKNCILSIITLLFWVIVSPIYLMFLLFAAPFYMISLIYKANQALDIYLQNETEE